MNKPVIIGAGSCIIQAVLQQFALIPGLRDKAELHLSQVTGGGRERVPQDLLSRAVIVIEEAAPWQGAGTLLTEERALLPEACTTVTVPTLHFNSLWPLMTEDPRNVPEPGAPYGRLPFGMGDRLGLRLFQNLPDLSSRRKAYHGTELKTVANLARSHELEVRNCFAREQGCDVRAAAFVMSHFREKRLYFTHNHPTGELMYFVLCQLFAVPVLRDFIRLPYDQLVVLARHWADTSNIFGGEEAPIHPAVAEHYGLKWWRRDLRYSWLGKTHTFDEWIDFYLSYDPEGKTAPAAIEATPDVSGRVRPEPGIAEKPDVVPLPCELRVGPFLAVTRDSDASVGRLQLATARTVQRPPPFVSQPADPTLSPYGYFFSDPNEATYQPGEAFVATLRDAEVLGIDGIVLHQGRIVADTMRNFRVGAASALIAEGLSGGIRLHEAAQIVSRRLNGPHFCGFSGLWHDYGHWMLGCMPRLVAFVMRRATTPGLRLILPALPAAGFQVDTLRLLGISSDSIEVIGPSERLVCDELHLTPAFDLWKISPFGRIAAECLVEAWAAQGGTEAGVERLHIPAHRGGAAAADPLLAANLAMRGFRTVSFDGLGLSEQIGLLRGAHYVIAEGGTAMTNLFFARHGSRVLELFAPRGVQPMNWSIAAVCGLQYGFQIGAPAGECGGFTVATQLFGWAIDQMLHTGPAAGLPPERAVLSVGPA